MGKQAAVFTFVAIAAAIATLVAGLEPSFSRVGGAPIGFGIAAAGFAIAGAIANRSAK